MVRRKKNRLDSVKANPLASYRRIFSTALYKNTIPYPRMMDSPHPRKRFLPSKNKKRCEHHNPLLVRRKTRKVGDKVMIKRRMWKTLQTDPHTDLSPLWPLEPIQPPPSDWVMVARPAEEVPPATRPSRWTRFWKWVTFHYSSVA